MKTTFHLPSGPVDIDIPIDNNLPDVESIAMIYQDITVTEFFTNILVDEAEYCSRRVASGSFQARLNVHSDNHNAGAAPAKGT